MPQTISYPTIVQNVREIGVFGTADLTYWREQLRAYQLFPFNANGHAQLFINATALKWNNISARECVFAVLLSRSVEANTFDGTFLLYAFNSRWLFALAERQAFASPYYHAAIDFEMTPPRFQVGAQNKIIIAAARKNNALARTADETWEYPIVLPPLDGSMNPPQKFFYAKLSGATQIFPFAPDDEFNLPSTHARVIQQLRESNFTPTEWRQRADATHCKSNTFTIGKDAPNAFAL